MPPGRRWAPVAFPRPPTSEEGPAIAVDIAPRTGSPADRTSGRGAEGRRFAHVDALDGLRGLAVALVVLYHFAPDLVPGGFLGVDVFFVLSGFLLTSLALGEHQSTGTIAAGAFFARRARRLLPAAIVTVVVTVAVAMALDPRAWSGTIRGQAVASLLYVNNWWAIAEQQSYQAVFGAESPLNHFWSLSIEEQFYAVFPLALLALAFVARRRGRGTVGLARLLLATAVVGTAASALDMAVRYDPLADPSPLYYGTGTRLQAVLLGVAGGCAVWLWRDRIRRGVPAGVLTALAVTGTLLVIVAAAQAHFRDGWLYRGGFLLVGVAALAAVVSVAVHRGPAARAMEVRPIVVLGLFSYGVYLVHWPVRVFLDQDRTGLDGVALFALRVAVTAVLTYVSYRVVERPFRSPRTGREPSRMHRTLRAPRGAAVAVGAVLGAVALVWVVARPSVAAEENSVLDVPTVDATPAAIEPLRVMWTGDSVAWTLAGGRLEFPQSTTYATVFDPAQVSVWNLGRYSCPMLAAPSRSFDVVRAVPSDCPDPAADWPGEIELFGADVVAWSGGVFDTNAVNLDGRWVEFGTAEWDAAYLARLDAARSAVAGSGATFVLVGQNDPIANPSEPHQEALRPEDLWRFGHLRDLQRGFAAAHPDDTRFLDLQALLCPTGTCPTAAADGTTYRVDGLHWTPESARLVTATVTAALYQLLDRTPPG